jgi:hypothetical protein
MTDEQPVDRHPTDEPDGTTAYAASLRQPGDSVTSAPAEADEPGAGEPGADEPGAADVDRAGYDVGAVAGDTDAYRPE